MVEEQRRRVEDRINEMMEEIDKSYLRKMQSDMHRCAATCCDNETYSIQKVHNCVRNCSSSLNKAQEYIQGEVVRTQNRLERCVMDCNDKIKDKMGPNPRQSEIDKYNDDFQKCATICVDNYCDSLPSLVQTMKHVLSNKNYE
ncbi:protein FAM136A-like [Colletes gigas]|uniref:protein FAM136A-like n=1 Tax=Colletes gigas TaxID=935657 RepID=UPI001C9AC8AC|nr:protein FAM136A-like [Colletes gigas]